METFGWSVLFISVASLLIVSIRLVALSKGIALTGGSRPSFRRFVRDNWYEGTRSFLALMGALILTGIVRPEGLAGVLWFLLVFVLCTISVLMAMEWNPGNSVARLIEQWIWAKKLWGQSLGFAIQCICLGVMAFFTLVAIVIMAFGSVELPSVSAPTIPNQGVTGEAAGPTSTPSPSETPTVDTEPKQTTEPSPSETVVVPAPVNTSPVPVAADALPLIRVETPCAVMNLYKDTQRSSKFGPKGVEVCVGDGWIDWSDWRDTAPSSITYDWTAKAGDEYYFLIKFEGKLVLTRTGTVQVK